ncbi:DUF1819 family protein [Nocardia sp. NBC_00565]|uniref:DUF1819 family protein n=1 Tax=Nocardia sp. NBC_00565 TaxID=2975993 RepID=UPI002E808928|nr:DUF1819 family protein [Nocardia sp. NBC_00565]WUC04286.1 DUF1819 family protein [Nocardia sp. NBC_00565]
MALQSASTARYALSFTSGALLMREAVIAAPIYLREGDWSKVREIIGGDNLLQARTVSSGLRLGRETVQRLAVLTDAEIELLTEATATERGHLLWSAACRRYGLIGEFAEEVVRERFLMLTVTLDHGDFDGFVRGKALWHTELAELKDSTLRKLRANVFKMLSEAGLLSDRGHILQVVLSQRVSGALADRTPSELRFFPTNDAHREN